MVVPITDQVNPDNALSLIHISQNLLADRGYDTSEIVAFALSAGINVVIPPKKNRKVPREYDRYLYKIRHLVENAFLCLKRWRGIATRYAGSHVPRTCLYHG